MLHPCIPHHIASSHASPPKFVSEKKEWVKNGKAVLVLFTRVTSSFKRFKQGLKPDGNSFIRAKEISILLQTSQSHMMLDDEQIILNTSPSNAIPPNLSNQTSNTSIATNTMITNNNDDASPESLIHALDTSLLKLQQNLAHNREIFKTKAESVLERLKEMEEMSKALQAQEAINTSQ
jgi:hypothetical protein